MAVGGRASDTTRSPASGDHSTVEPPGPIPNPEVKRRCADGSGATGPVRVGRRQVCARLLPKRKGPGFFVPMWAKKHEKSRQLFGIRAFNLL